MLKQLLLLSLLLGGTYTAYSQSTEVPPAEYKVSNEYFKLHYVKDAEDQKIVDLFNKKRKGATSYLVGFFISSAISNYTSTIVLSNTTTTTGTTRTVTASPFVPVSLTLLTVSIARYSRYSKKKKYLYVTGKEPIPVYVEKRISKVKE